MAKLKSRLVAIRSPHPSELFQASFRHGVSGIEQVTLRVVDDVLVLVKQREALPVGVFVGDVSIPDGTPVRPGEQFEKSWELRNAGTVPWVGRYLSRVGAGEGYNLAGTPPRVPIQDTQPGQNVIISVPVRAPRSAATCIVHWKMTDESGRLYFPDRYWLGVYLLIVVPGPH